MARYGARYGGRTLYGGGAGVVDQPLPMMLLARASVQQHQVQLGVPQTTEAAVPRVASDAESALASREDA